MLIAFTLARSKVGQVLFHPVANHVLAAATGDHVIKLYDVEAGGDGAQVEMTGFSDSIQSLAFDWTGTTLVATCRDRKLRTFDTRKGGKAVQEAESHGGIKGARVAWCGQLDRFITTGESREVAGRAMQSGRGMGWGWRGESGRRGSHTRALCRLQQDE